MSKRPSFLACAHVAQLLGKREDGSTTRFVLMNVFSCLLFIEAANQRIIVEV